MGNLEVVAPSKQDAKVLLYVGLPPASRTQAFEAAVDSMEALRERTQSSAEIYHEEDAEKLAARAEQDLRAER